MSDAKRLYLLDGTALVYRAYFAFIRNPLINSKGENTSAPFGFVSALLKIVREEAPDYLAVVFDSAQPTFRHERFPAYKATRERMPEELVAQLPRIDQIVEAFGVPIVRLDGFEADDLIGTLAVQGQNAGLDVTIVTGDKDLMQLVNNRVTILAPGKTRNEWERIGPEEVVARWGVSPEQIRDLLGLMGDSSDNIPGVPKVGEKTAVELLKKYGSLDAVLEAAPEIQKPMVRQNLMDFASQARLSKELATIAVDAPVTLDLEAFTWVAPDPARVVPVFRELEFNQLIEQLGVQAPGPANKLPLEFRTVTADMLPGLCEQIRAAGAFSFDTETTSTDPRSASLVGISLACDGLTGYYLPIGHRNREPDGLAFTRSAESPVNLPLTTVKEHLQPLFADTMLLKIGQNTKFDLAILHRAGFAVDAPLFDTMIASYILDPSARHGLDAMAEEHLGHRMIPITDLIGKGKDEITFDLTPVDKATEYSGEDAVITYRLGRLFEERLKTNGLDELFRTLEMPLVPVLLQMEETGIRVDAEALRDLSREISQQLHELEEQVYEAAGEKFNINSTQQLAHILFDVIGLPARRKTKTGYSTDVDVLEALAPLHPLPKLVLQYRSLAKLLSTYVDALPKLVNKKTGRIHTSFNQTVTATGRLSSTDPNLQNIPVRTELGGQVRRAFVPEKGWLMLSADYSQIELRIMAHLSEDTTLIKAFQNDEDIHTLTASLVFGVPPAQVNRELRAQAKTINFGVIYGQTPFGLSQQLGIPQREAALFIENYFKTYPGVKKYGEVTIERARKDGFVSTMLGRRRFVPDIDHQDVNRRRFAERTAINTPIQGTAADMIKLAMIRIHERIAAEKLRARMLLQVHDELLFEVPPDECDALKDLVRAEMSGALELRVPVRVDIGVGENWLVAH
ncbi:MAG TPA: DNA polymerase I [Candidatus Latescibacteria bacterium]|nr:DNA polymerase I [Candidatus Latescibacterota bacterium]